ncbi:Pescadillo N-terminus-domain-containing protein [Gloeopeniophorella convolvens]|nr:Pescadillo N-terminus-domain-containing protein [Gloeopeniophorella convolvens]
MGRLRQKGQAGAAKAYVTRSMAIKKLQCSLADFRRLCILKGIFPREPRHRKRANRGSSAPTSFYYAKDIAYLAHEPVLRKLREHKAFAKRLARALGRGEWSSAKSLEENKPVYRLDHIIKERYPTFIDAVRDIDDALCMIFLFASLPSNDRVSASLVENCARLAAEWQLYVMRTNSLRKVFLSIKGVYYQAEVMDQLVTWLVPYQFTQSIPSDVDIRVMLTFLELYQTLLGFVFFKLYTDVGLVYPPPLDAHKQDTGAGIDAFILEEKRRERQSSDPLSPHTAEAEGKKVSSKAVRQAIKALAASGISEAVPENGVPAEEGHDQKEEEFVSRPSASNPEGTTELPTLHSLSSLPQNRTTNIFAPYTFFLSRETSRPIFEFIVRCFGGRIGWPSTSGSGSILDEADESITHVIIDRPAVQRQDETDAERSRRQRRKYVQPQWVVDCINSGKILLEEPYSQGKILPPHLSPFGDREGAYDPRVGIDEDAAMNDAEGGDESAEDGSDDAKSVSEHATEEPLEAVIQAARSDPAVARAAELEAEAGGMDYGTFEKRIAKSPKKSARSSETNDSVEDMNKMMLSNKQRKLYEKIKYSERKRQAENAKLEERRKSLRKTQKRELKSS